MRTVQASELSQNHGIYDEMAEILSNDGIICAPAGSTYRLFANVLSQKALINCLQIKRRTKKAPVLLFAPHLKAVQQVVADIPTHAHPLIETFWPGDLTLLFELNQDLPKKIRRNINSKGKVGVRIPKDDIALQLTRKFDGPLLVSSANIARKVGASSEAQIRKNFGRWIDLFISAGDLPGNQHSTVIDITTESPSLKRAGTIDFEAIMQVLTQTQDTPQDQPSPTPVSIAV